MYINNKSFKDVFHCDVVSFSATTMEVISDVYFSDNSFHPVVAGVDMKPAQKELILDFESSNDMSNFAAEICKPFTLDVKDGFFYECVLLSKGEQDDGYQTSFTCTYSMYAIKKKPLIVQKIDTFIVEGNIQCDALYEITSSQDIEECTIDNMRIHNLKANKTLKIDGIHKLVYYQETPLVSAMQDVELSTFPKLQIGSYTVVKSEPDVKVIIQYYPMYL